MSSLYQQLAGQSIATAMKRLENDIRQRPTDADLRAAFVQLLCLAGNWPRATLQLKSWLALTPSALPTVTLLEQAVQGERQRAAVFAAQAQPKMPDHAWPWLTDFSNALNLSVEAANICREQALERAELNPGSLTDMSQNTHTFDWLMDGDTRLGPLCEVIVNGQYFWIPFQAIAEIRFQAPASVTDLIWRHASVTLTDGSEQVCQIPARYPLSEQNEENELLSQTTHWQPMDQQGNCYQGKGQKIWLNDQKEFPILSLDTVSFT
ncbi:type VI secretion system accessory protein TagJ [Rosenbergiella epipactidis]|uniref:type VI secretion system accessory protein TagJ n=1 Tax=Rosenbergiella epipactidis TaxID=1544694 RepID=UPI001F4E14F4|nr:type VI secretion system accessory protein TagJ [Rosenbergiella epipactidis]